jgi:hypothetical protein
MSKIKKVSLDSVFAAACKLIDKCGHASTTAVGRMVKCSAETAREKMIILANAKKLTRNKLGRVVAHK